MIRERIIEIAGELNTAYKGKNPVFLGVLNGSFMFLADIYREITVPSEVSFIRLKSYKNMSSTGEVKELLGLENNLEGRHVIIVEDIVDTGRTLNHIINEFKNLGALSIEVLTLLHKPEASTCEAELKYIGFEIPDKFVVGYGLDYEGEGRNLKDIYQLVE